MQGRQCFTAVMLLVGLSVTAFATADSEETTPAAVEDWKAARLEQLKARLEMLVADGSITQEQADAFLAQVEERMASCDGTGCVNQDVCNDCQRSCNGRGNGCQQDCNSCGNGWQQGSNGCGNLGQCGFSSGSGRRGGQGRGMGCIRQGR